MRKIIILKQMFETFQWLALTYNINLFSYVCKKNTLYHSHRSIYLNLNVFHIFFQLQNESRLRSVYFHVPVSRQLAIIPIHPSHFSWRTDDIAVRLPSDTSETQILICIYILDSHFGCRIHNNNCFNELFRKILNK